MTVKGLNYIKSDYHPSLTDSNTNVNYSHALLTQILISINMQMFVNRAPGYLAMYVCVCKGITDHQIKDAIYAGATTLGKLRKALGVASQCGKCTCLTRELIDETLPQAEYVEAQPLHYAVA